MAEKKVKSPTGKKCVFGLMVLTKKEKANKKKKKKKQRVQGIVVWY